MWLDLLAWLWGWAIVIILVAVVIHELDNEFHGHL